MSAAVVLNADPAGILSNPNSTHRVMKCRQWLVDWLVAGRRVLLPEVVDYEVRRELIRAGMAQSLTLLDTLAQQAEYLPITTGAMRRAAELWAQARSQGWQTAPDPALDCDVILAAQALTLGEPAIIVATGNVRHIARYVPADAWTNIVP